MPGKKYRSLQKSKIKTSFADMSKAKAPVITQKGMSPENRAKTINQRLKFITDLIETGKSDLNPNIVLNKKGFFDSLDIAGNSIKLPEKTKEIIWKKFIWFINAPGVKKTNLSVEQKQKIFSHAANFFWKRIIRSKTNAEKLTPGFADLRKSLGKNFSDVHETDFPSSTFFQRLFYEMVGKPVPGQKTKKTINSGKKVMVNKITIDNKVIFELAKTLNAEQIAKRLGADLRKVVYKKGGKNLVGFVAVQAIIADAGKLKRITADAGKIN